MFKSGLTIKWRGFSKYLLIACLSLGLSLSAFPSRGMQSRLLPLSTLDLGGNSQIIADQGTRIDGRDFIVQATLEQGQQLYEAGNFSAAAKVLEEVVQTAKQREDRQEQAIALRNLALVYQSLGDWERANQTVATGLNLLNSSGENRSLLASMLDVQGSLQLQQGQVDAALGTWEKANSLYRDLGETEKAIANQINQAQALQRLGFYRRAIAILTPIVQIQAPLGDSLGKAVALRSLGDALRFVGELEASKQSLEKSLEIAKRLQLPAIIANSQLSLGNTLQALGNTDNAVALYQEVAMSSVSETLRVQALLNQLGLLVETKQTAKAQVLWDQIQGYLDSLPVNNGTIFARINLARNLIKLNVKDNPTPSAIAQILVTAIQQARELKDIRAQSYALGTLGNLYELSRQWSDARKLTEQALLLVQDQASFDIAYQWQWQLGRIDKAQGDYNRAIANYSAAVNTLKALRNDLVAVNPTVQVSFQDSVEPIHRELVSLLLDRKRGEITSSDLEQSLKIFESLQLAELDNFLKEACLKATPVNIDQIDAQAAVIYPIILPDRLELIVSLPKQQLRHYTIPVTEEEFESVVNELRQLLARRIGRRYLTDSQKIYNWIIRPAEADLAANQVKTLVFVLDGSLRNLPMAVLQDGQNFLIEKYSLALTPGLQLLNPRPLQEQNLRVFTGGLSEPRQGFSGLPNIVSEVKQIESVVPARVLLNQNFTEAAFKQALTVDAVPIVHLATHGKFSSNKNDTFILTWDERLDISSLTNILQAAQLNQPEPIELLVLSACETATGDRLAALGMAGMAVRSGVRSTVASLWQISDEATAIFMNRFYEVLSSQKSTKAEALRQAQLQVLRDPRFRGHPYFWAPYVLIGNWL
jgi:CHAT domain-containing protein